MQGFIAVDSPPHSPLPQSEPELHTVKAMRPIRPTRHFNFWQRAALSCNKHEKYAASLPRGWFRLRLELRLKRGGGEVELGEGLLSIGNAIDGTGRTLSSVLLIYGHIKTCADLVRHSLGVRLFGLPRSGSRRRLLLLW